MLPFFGELCISELLGAVSPFNRNFNSTPLTVGFDLALGEVERELGKGDISEKKEEK